MNLDYFKRKLPCELSLPTLGGESSFKVTNTGTTITITNAGGAECILTEAFVDEISTRYNQLTVNGEQRMAGRYVPDHYTPINGPFIFSPYVAKIIDYLSPD